jgi:hypothetical protein
MTEQSSLSSFFLISSLIVLYIAIEKSITHFQNVLHFCENER